MKKNKDGQIEKNELLEQQEEDEGGKRKKKKKSTLRSFVKIVVFCALLYTITYPNEKHLISALADAENILFFGTAQKVKELSEKEKYDEALNELDKARKIYPCENFDALYKDIESKSSKLLWLKNKVIDFKGSVVGFFQKDVEEVKRDGGIAYVKKSGGKILLGDYSKDDVTILSCAGDGALALAGLDAAQDVRDLTHDIQHIGEEDNWVTKIAVDTIAVVPVIGAIKYLKYLKQTGKAADVTDNAGAVVKAADKMTVAAKTVDKAGDITKESRRLSDKLKDTKLGNLVAEKKKLRFFEFEEVRTINQNFLGKYYDGTKFIKR